MTTGDNVIEPFPGLAMTEEMREAVKVEERFVPGLEGDPDVRVILYAPKSLEAKPPLIVSIHGGAFAMRADHFPALDAGMAMLGAQVVSVDYRSLPENRFPDGLRDCYAAVSWSVNELDIDPSRVVVTGGSAGGALSAATALMARDRGGPFISFQALRIPVLDDRLATPSMAAFGDGHRGFNRESAVAMWDSYLAGTQDSDITPYAAPGRAADLAGLPPAFIQVGGLDPLRDEGIIYAMRLMEAGVPVELYCAPGAYHGTSEDTLDPRTMKVAYKLYLAALAAAIA